MRYLVDIAHAFTTLVLLAALGGLSVAIAMEWRSLARISAALFPDGVIAVPTATLVKPVSVAPPATPASLQRRTINLDADETQHLMARRLLIPVEGLDRSRLRDNFEEMRGLRRHEALDIMAPRGTPVLAAGDGRVAKLFRSPFGGITLYQADPEEKYIYYYAHLDRYADGVKEGAVFKRGDVLGYVGSTGNASASAPHLHFTIFRMGPDRKWWKGTPVNPYAFLVEARSPGGS